MPRKVYIPNRSFHNFSDAERFGELVFLTEGMISPRQVNSIARSLTVRMQDATEDDLILVSSLPIINAIAAGVMSFAFGRINFLIWEVDHYVERNIVLGDPALDVEEKEVAG